MEGIKHFGIHPSKELQDLYKRRYWQCQDPSKAKIIFLGLDANWDIDIANNPTFYKKAQNYLTDGISFWEKEGVHHPFLLDEYNKGDGYRFHLQFSKLGLQPKHAEYISFIELLNVPTYGMSTAKENQSIFEGLLSGTYLSEIDNILFNGQGKLVFIPKSLYNKYLAKIRKKHHVFNFGIDPENTKGEYFFNVNNSNNNFIFLCNHFSSAIHDTFLKNMSTMIKSFLGEVKEDIWWVVEYVGAWNGEQVEECRYIKAKNIVEVKKILSKYMSIYRIENDLSKLILMPVENSKVKVNLIWS